jgi:transposase
MGLGPIHLLLDCYSAHRTGAVKETATRLEITLHFTAPGLKAQAVFGVLKAQAKRLFHAEFHLNPSERRTKQDSVEEMVSVWSLVGESAFDSAWDVYNE